MTTNSDLFKALREPFAPADIEWRIGQAGKTKGGDPWAKVLAYVTNRAIMDRLDTVVGPENWRNEFQFVQGGAMCGLSIRVGGEWITKWDGADPSDIEAFKGVISGAMKRAAVQFGIGRYLYDLGESWAVINEKGAHYANCKIKDNGKDEFIKFKWDHPTLPAWALPSGTGQPPAATVAKLEEQTGGKVKPAAKVLDEPPLPDPTGKRLSPNEKRTQELIGFITAAKDETELNAIAELCKKELSEGKITKKNCEFLGSVSRQKRQSLAAMQEQDDFFEKSLNKELQQVE
jgi:hypothetical protein